MFKQLFVLSGLTAMVASSAIANDVVWQSPTPTAHVQNSATGAWVADCFATIRRDRLGNESYTPVDCPVSTQNHVNIGTPTKGPIVNMTGFPEATTAHVNPRTGLIELR